MARNHPYLERRQTAYYWRRRVPCQESNRFQRKFFCFSLRTHVLREAAELARRLTAISELCFNAECGVTPEAMEQILVGYARLEIETADRLRALTGHRTRAAAEATLKLEAAARASLRDAIFLCDRKAALAPIRDTAARLGIEVEEQEEDFSILADKMLRLMIEISDEKERRSRGYFSDVQPYLAQALNGSTELKPILDVTAPRNSCSHDVSQVLMPPGCSEATARTGKLPMEDTTTAFHVGEEVAISVNQAHGESASVLDDSSPLLLDIWDQWFDEMSRGVTRSGAYVLEDSGKAARFRKDADTILSTRKLISDILGNLSIDQATGANWHHFNETICRLPNNHGKSPKLRHVSCIDFIRQEEAQEQREKSKVERRIEKEKLIGDEAEKLRRNACIARIAPRTFQRHQKYLSVALDHAVNMGRLSKNPFRDYVLSENVINELRKSRPETKRKLWTSHDIQSLLRTEKWSSPRTAIHDPVYWLPIIARLHGLRSEEILQLKPDDVRLDEGIYYFDIE